MKVVVAEKPSVARDIARVLGCRRRENGYLLGEHYAVTWAFGHLVRIAEPETMDEAWGQPWSREQLPMIPSPFRYEVTDDGREQFEVIRALLQSADTDGVIAATDAGREGEHIFRLIYELAGADKPCERLWIRSLTDEAVRAGFDALQPAAAFDALAAAARSRAEADWLIGLNFTRAYTLHNRQLCTVGRVQTPTLALVVGRQAAIDGFQARKFYEVHVELEPGFVAKVLGPDDKSRFEEEDRAREVCAELEGIAEAVLTELETQEKTQKPPALFDLLTLQKEANKRFGFTASETLELAQSLYETQKLLSYPRTESRHLSTDMVATLPAVVDALQELFPEAVDAARQGLAKPLTKTYVDDTKLTDHHAILPTNRDPHGLSLSDAERKLYELVCRRFLAIFLPPLVRAETVARLSMGSHVLQTKGSVVVSPGWTLVQPPADERGESDEDGKAAQKLPALVQGDAYANRSVAVQTRTTKPPRPYTDATLLDAMKKAGSELDDADLKALMKHSGLGTPATRAAVLDRLLKSGYLERKRKTLVPTDKGTALIGQVHPELCDPVLTAVWEQRLKDIEDGRLSPAEFDGYIVDHLRELLPQVFEQSPLPLAEAEGLAPCPACGDGVIRESPRAFGCTRWKEGCSFTVWKRVAGKTLTARHVQELLVRKQTKTLKGFTSKAGKKFDAALALDPASGKVRFVFDGSH